MFKFKNISSEQMNVVCEEENQFISRAAHRYEEITIDGSNISIFNDLGYATKDKTMKLYIKDVSKINDILSWLNGTGEFEYDGKYTIARFLDSADPIRAVTIRTLDISFKMLPFWFKANDDFVEVSDTIDNEGNNVSYPIIKIVKGTEKQVKLLINDIELIYDFPDEEDYVEIDSFNCTVQYKNLNRNRNIKLGFDFPTLNPGQNNIEIKAGDSIIYIKRKDCWL